MSTHEMLRDLLAQLEDPDDPRLGPGNNEWMFYELGYAWTHAQAEARSAYIDWCDHPGVTAYTVYRAAQDRADAAQDALTRWRQRPG